MGFRLDTEMNNQCPPHHYVVNSLNVGKCRKCGKEKDFGKLLKEIPGAETARGQRKGWKPKKRIPIIGDVYPTHTCKGEAKF